MKQFIITTIAILTLGSAVFASQEVYQGGVDQMNEIIKCHPLVARPGSTMQIIVSTGGIAGITQVVINRFTQGHSSSNTYIVNALPQDLNKRGEGITYAGTDIRLTANFTTLLPDGGHYGVLKTKMNDSIFAEELSCALVIQNPQVNYTY